jgi:aspartate aminotransferase
VADDPGLRFGDLEAVDLSLADRVRGLVGSEILRIAAEVRERVASGQPVCNLTVGDFDPREFPIPRALREGIEKALAKGETNYPPSDGILALREAVCLYTERQWRVRYPVGSALIASGARPVLYAAYRTVLNPGDEVVYSVPSWNNNHYAWLAAGRAKEILTSPETGFLPTLDQLAPHLGSASLVVLNTPLNPAGTVLDPAELRAIAAAIVEENERRRRLGRRHVFLLFDQVYGALVFGGRRHEHPARLVPEAAPWVITVDGISKAFAATGLRVGWALAPPPVAARMRDVLGHVGAWAPRAEQVAVAEFLGNEAELASFRLEMDRKIRERLEALHAGFERLKAEGHPVDCVSPQGAIYLSLRLDLVGRTVGGRPVRDNEEIRRLLLEEAGVAAVPFQAFGLREDTGWFRLSVGAVSVEEIEGIFPRLRRLFDRVREPSARPSR